MAIASIGARSSGVSGGAGTTVTQTPGAIVAAGRQLLVFVGYNSASDVACNVTDNVAAANVYEELGAFGSGNARLRVYRCNVITQLASTSVITATFGSSLVDKTIASWEYSVAAGMKLALGPANTTVAVNPAANGFGSVAHSGLSSLSRLYLRCGVKIVSSTATITATTNFTSWGLAIRSRNNASAVVPRAEHRINTSTGETSNPTFAVSGVAASVFLALVETAITSTGTFSGTLGDFTVASDGTVQSDEVTGTLAATLGDFTASGVGVAPVVGTASTTLGAFTVASAGAAPVVGSSASEIGAFTVAASGVAPATGDLAKTIGDFTVASTGDTGGDVEGTASITLGDFGLASSGVAPVVGQAAATLGEFTVSSVGVAPVVGVSSPTLGQFTVAATGAGLVRGTAAVAIADFGVSSGGSVRAAGGVSATLDGFTLAATGTTAQITVGSLSATLGDFTVSVAGVAPVAGIASASIGQFTAEAVGKCEVRGSAAASLGAFTLFSSNGTPPGDQVSNNYGPFSVVVDTDAQTAIVTSTSGSSVSGPNVAVTVTTYPITTALVP